MAGTVIKNRYERKAVLGRGGMGVVYHAFDTLMRRDVALKTLRDVPSNVFLELFSRECGVLAAMVHPNIIEIFDMGEFDDDGISKPYFVMPLLPGRTLHDLIYPGAIPLSTSRCVDIISQACRGLQAAHEQGLLHRDIKPRNIFVMRDDAVKIIDFGVAHLVGNNSTGFRGTPLYMSPEQIGFKQLTNRSDIFSLAVVCYETLTAAHPFLRRADRKDSDIEIADAIAAHLPPLASELNPSVSRTVAQVVAKGMAKDAWSRFESAAAFSEALRKALRNENPVPTSVSVRTRLERARRSFEQRDLQFASEIVRQLEAEGHSDAEIAELRRELDEMVQRERTDRLIEAANRCFESEEYSLALRKIQEILENDAENVVALALKKRIEDLLTEQKVAELLRVAAEHLERSAFTNARQAVQDALKLLPNDIRARQFLIDVDTRQKELLRQRQEQERLYQSAQAALLAGKLELAMENLERLAQLTAQSGDARDRADDYRELHRRVRAEHDALKAALEHAKKLLGDDLVAAQKICDRYLAKYSDQPDFLALRHEIVRRREEQAEAFRKSIAEKLEREDSPEARLRIAEDALKSHPKDEYFKQQVRSLRDKAREVAEAVERARELEGRLDFRGAAEQWNGLRSIYPRFPRLDQEIARVTSAFEKQRAEAKESLVKRIENTLRDAAHQISEKLLREAELEFPADDQIAELRSRKERQVEQFARVQYLLNLAKQAVQGRRFQDAADALAEAGKLSADVPVLRSAVFSGSVEQAEALVNADWRAAKLMLEQAANFYPDMPLPSKLRDDVLRRERNEDIQALLDRAAAAERADQFQEACQVLQQGLEKHTGEPRLQSRLNSLEKVILENRRKEERERKLRTLREVRDSFAEARDASTIHSLLAKGTELAEPYGQEPEFASIIRELGELVAAYESANSALSRDQTNECLNICNKALGSNPGHQYLLDLKARAEAREREKAAEFLDHVERRLAAEVDIRKRGRILEEALRKYPNEKALADKLALVRDEERLIQKIADRAQHLESDKSVSEALEQWSCLKTAYPGYPGVDEAIVRCTELLREQRQKARSGYVATARKLLENRDYAAAADQVKEARLEFPDDEELSALANLISERSELRARALDLLSQAERDFESIQFQPGRDLIQEALQVGKNEPDIPKSAAKILVQYASQALARDFLAAESMLADAKLADPAVIVSNELRKAFAEARRLKDFEELSSRVHSLEEDGSFKDALDRTREFLKRYPGDPQAEAMENRLLKAKEEAEARQRRELELSELKSFEDQVKTVSHVESLLDLLKRTQQIAHRHAVDSEVTRVAEHLSSVLSAMAQIRKLLDEDRLDDAEELCDQSIVKFSQHSALQQLRSQIEVRQNERASEYLREVEQKLSSERDFGKQEQILQQAIRLYPKESYYVDELALVRNKQALLEAEIARSRELESKGLYEDAIGEWEGLRGQYPWYAGIDNEIERARREWNLKITAIRDNWTGQIHRALRAGEVDTAAAALQEASIEMTGDPILNDLQAEIEHAMLAQRERQELVTRGGEFLREHRYAEAAEFLTRATGIFKDDASLRGWIVELMLSEARDSAEGDWEGSEALLNAIRQVEPGYPIPSELSRAILSKRREAEIDVLFQQVQKAESNSDWMEAKRLLDAGHTKFPEDANILERQKAVSERIRQQEVQRARDEARQNTADFHARIQHEGKKRGLAKLQSAYVAKGYVGSQDPEIRALAAALIAEIESKLHELEAPKRKQISSTKGPAGHRIPPDLKRLMYVAVPLALLLAGAAYVWFVRSPELTPVELSVTPAGVAVSINGQSCVTPECNIRLPAGKYELQLAKNGYEPERTEITVGSRENHPIRVSANLTPSTPAIQIAGNLESGDISLDGKRVGTLTAGLSGLSNIAPGLHVLKISSTEGDATIPISQDAIAGPRTGDPLIANGVSVTAISTNGQKGTLATSSRAAQPVLLDHQSAGSTLNGSLLLPALPPGNHHILIGRPGDLSSFDLTVHARPSIFVFIAGSKPTGSLEVTTNIPGADLFIDGKKYGAARDGNFRLILPAKAYKLYAAREGYTDSETARIDIAKGSQAAVTLRLTPKPALLEIRGASPGTEIKMDGRLLGSISSGGSLKRPVAPGAHSFDVSRKGFSAKRLQRVLGPGTTTILTREDLDLVPLTADASAREAEDWNRLGGSPKMADLQAFLQRFPNGAHAQEASDKVQQMEWGAVDKKSSTALIAFASKYPDSGHAAEARQLMQNIAAAGKARAALSEWGLLDKSNKEALRQFIAKYPDSAEKNSAQQLLAYMAQKEEAAAQQKAEETAWKSVNVTDRNSLESYLGRFPDGKYAGQAKQLLTNLAQQQASEGEAASVLAVLKRYAAAWGAKDVESILSLQPSLNRRQVKSVLAPVRVWRMNITPVTAPQINGSRATVTCKRKVDQTFSDGTEMSAPESVVTFVLSKQGSGWIISAVE